MFQNRSKLISWWPRRRNCGKSIFFSNVENQDMRKNKGTFGTLLLLRIKIEIKKLQMIFNLDILMNYYNLVNNISTSRNYTNDIYLSINSIIKSFNQAWLKYDWAKAISVSFFKSPNDMLILIILGYSKVSQIELYSCNN